MSLPTRITGRILETPGGCWIWQGARSSAGYGQTYWQGRLVYVHRLMWEHVTGAPLVGEGHHRCPNRACCRPHPEHVVDLGRSAHMREHRAEVCKRGHPMTDENRYVRPDGRGTMCRTCIRARNRTPEAMAKAREYARRRWREQHPR